MLQQINIFQWLSVFRCVAQHEQDTILISFEVFSQPPSKPSESFIDVMYMNDNDLPLIYHLVTILSCPTCDFVFVGSIKYW